MLKDPELVQSGDKVQVALKDRAVHKGRITDIGPSTVLVGETTIQIANIEGLKTKQYSAGKTTALVGGVGLSVVAVTTLTALAATVIGAMLGQ